MITTPERKSWIANFFETLGKSIIDNPELLDPEAPLPSCEYSSIISTLEKRDPSICILGGNGMNTTMEGAVDHANHMIFVMTLSTTLVKAILFLMGSWLMRGHFKD